MWLGTQDTDTRRVAAAVKERDRLCLEPTVEAIGAIEAFTENLKNALLVDRNVQSAAGSRFESIGETP